MATKTLVKRINIILPEELLHELYSYIPRPRRNQFLVDLIEREIRRLRIARALQESAGAWLQEDHPDLATLDDIDWYVRRMREASSITTLYPQAHRCVKPISGDNYER